MMPPNYLQATKQKDDQENHQTSSGGGRKTAASRPQEQAVKCPRCDSPNTKFCYYNNYSLTQPRHFCKTCRRYWTKGGALRHVPIGGGCRKNKKMKSSSTSRLSMSIDSKDSSGSSEIGGFKFFNGLLSPPTMDFNLGGLSFPRMNLNPSTSGLYNNQFSSFGDLSATSSAAVSVTSPSCFSLEFDPSGAGGSSSSSLMGFNNYGITTSGFNNSAIQETAGCGGAGNSMNVHTNLASSIESLSSINQDLHWKLQQQRLAMLFGGGGGETDPKDSSVSSSVVPIQNQQPQKPQPILFQNLEISKPEANCGGLGGGGGNNSRKGGASGGVGGDIATEWYFGNSFEQVTAATASRNGNSNANDNNTNKWNGVQTWSDLHHQYNALP